MASNLSLLASARSIRNGFGFCISSSILDKFTAPKLVLKIYQISLGVNGMKYS